MTTLTSSTIHSGVRISDRPVRLVFELEDADLYSFRFN